MRRIAFCCLAIAALSTTILADGTDSALAAKPTKSAVESKTTAKSALASKPTKIALASKPSKKNSAVPASSSDVVNEARRWIGTNPTGWSHVWCARFMNFVLKRTGHPGTGSDMASSFADYGRRVWWPQVGAIAVMKRGRNGGHVGVVSGINRDGNLIIISGNHNKRVGVGVYPRERVYAYVVPN
jgi:uncharacterized protein (TIGR02594 family)